MLTRENYFGPENSMKYMGSTQFKDFMQCEASALARVRGELPELSSTALLVGSYVDAHFEGTLDLFRAQHPEIFKRDGSLKAEFEQANMSIARAERDPFFMKFMAGEKQVIMTGVIESVPVKIRIDSYHADRTIVDLKCMRNFAPIWSDEERAKLPFVEAWGYDIQGAIYQEIVFQNTGKKLPFIIAGVTKEESPDLAVISIPQDRLDNAMYTVQSSIERYQDIKEGREEPTRCEHCDYCKATKVLTRVIDYREVGE